MAFCFKCGSALTDKVEDGVNRLACPSPSCGYVFYDNPVPVVAAVVERNGEVILARNAAWPEGAFALVTGFLEKGETPEDGIMREVREELGLNPVSVDFIGFYPFFAMNQLLLSFHVVAEGDILLSHEIAEVKCLKPEKVKPWPFGTGLSVRDWLERRKSLRNDK